MPLDITITNEQKVEITIHPVTAAGTPAAVDGVPVWTPTSGDSGIAVAADGLSAFLISADLPGDTTYLIQADADLGSGVVEVADTIILHVQGALATSLGLSAGTPVPK